LSSRLTVFVMVVAGGTAAVAVWPHAWWWLVPLTAVIAIVPYASRLARNTLSSPPQQQEQKRLPASGPASPPPSENYDDVVRWAVAELVQMGRLLFNPPKQMRLGQTKRVEVRVTRSLELDEELLKHLPGHDELEPETIQTAPKMAVTLKNVDDNFKIDPYSDEEQDVYLDEITTWQFRIRALKPGQQLLVLSVSLRIPVQGKPVVHKSIPVFEARIDVQVTLPARVGLVISAAKWQWIIGTAVVIVIGVATVVATLYH
jgi:hypothetical protein